MIRAPRTRDPVVLQADVDDGTLVLDGAYARHFHVRVGAGVSALHIRLDHVAAEREGRVAIETAQPVSVTWSEDDGANGSSEGARTMRAPSDPACPASRVFAFYATPLELFVF